MAPRPIRYDRGMSAALDLIQPLTVEEFLNWPDDEFGRRQQLIDGEIVTMSPPGEIHGTIQATLAYLLTDHLRRTRPGCRVVVTPGVVPRFRAAINARVPDLGVTCAPPAPDQRLVAEPLVLIEILSPNNKAATMANLWAYTTVPSVHEVVTLHSTRVGATVLRRQADGTWPPDAILVRPGGTLELASLGFSVPLAEAYVGTGLVSPENLPAP
jgi:Uma2 family endonuclease